jgi:hypothetical protein
MARHVPLAPIFPKSIDDITSAPYLGDNRREAELSAQKARLLASEPELIRAISSVNEINNAAFDGNSKEVAELIKAHAEDFGLSFLILRKSLSLRHSEFGKQNNIDLRPSIDPFLTGRRHLVAVAFEDSIDEELSYIRVRRTFLSHIENGRVSAAQSPILQDLMSPTGPMADQTINTLEAYSRWGVLDSLEFLERQILVERPGYNPDLAERIRAVVPRSVHEAWENAFEVSRKEDIIALIGGELPFCEYRLFRHASAWSEFPDVSLYRHQIESGFGLRLDGNFQKKRDVEALVLTHDSSIESYLPVGETRHPPSLPIDPQRSGIFHRTLAFISAQSATGAAPFVASGTELLNILDKTMDVSLLVSSAELSNLLPVRTGDRLYEYLRTALQYDAEESRVSDHAFRRATQEIIRRDHDADIVKFAQFLDENAPNVAEHFFATCTEYFLTELYLLFEDSNAVINAHASLLEWYGKSRKEDDTVTRAKSLRLNLRLRKVRGSIDDTRIYVDQLKFQYWATEKIAAQLRELIDSGSALLNDDGGYPNLNDPIEAVERPRTRLFQLLNHAYKEFCTNEFYGVDSYIGRRIRHGTLHGVLVAELKEPVALVAKDLESIAPSFSRFVKTWHSKVEATVRHYGLELLQVRSSERKNGLIFPSIGDSDKKSIAINMLNSVASALAEDRSTSLAISFIYDYCWLLLEIDLKRLRSAAMSAQQELVIRPKEHTSGASNEVDGQILDASRHLNAELQQRFEYLFGWLSRPSNVSPSATLSLLFHAVVLEVQGRYQGFSPNVIETGETGIDMFGHRFHTFYDVLFVLVDNAAKHGKREGELHFEVRSSETTDHSSDITMTVTSELAPGTEGFSREAIEKAMRSKLGSAMLEDQNSGIRKIRVLVSEVDELRDFEVTFKATSVTFSVVMNIVMTGRDHPNEVDQ